MAKPNPPQPPARASKEARQHPRFELFASVELHRAQETLVLPARNISLGGLYLAADGNDLSSLAVGEVVQIMLFDVADEGQPTVRADATIIRKDKEGLGLTWASTDPVIARKLATLLERLAAH
jgi:PilZ domain